MKEKEQPYFIRCFNEAKLILNKKPYQWLKVKLETLLSQSKIRLEYLELARENLEIQTTFSSSTPSILLIAAYVGEVRLIDNLMV